MSLRNCQTINFFHKKDVILRQVCDRYFSGKMATLGSQASLPSLPVPELADTCQRYLTSVQPFLNASDLERTKHVVDRFQNGIGRHLQKQLVKRSKEQRNWLNEWWLDMYLSYRGPLPYLSNTAGVSESPPQSNAQLRMAAITIWAIATEHTRLLRQEYPADKKGELCMFQYYKMLCGGRLPDSRKDRVISYNNLIPKPDGSMIAISSIRHVIVMKAGRIFRLECLDPHMQPYSTNHIHQELLKIEDICKEQGEGPSVGALTAVDRDSSYKAFKDLWAVDVVNQQHCQTVVESIFVLALDDNHTYNLDEMNRLCALGDCKNRWFDKSCSIIVSKTGMVGNNSDHTPLDGYVGQVIFEHIDSNAHAQNNKLSGCIEENPSSPLELEFVVNEHINDLIQQAFTSHRNNMKMFDLRYMILNGFGLVHAKQLKTEELKIRADNLVQMAIQLTYYKLHGKHVPTYQTASVRKYYCGRTETLRVCTNEMAAFTKAMLDPKLTRNEKVGFLKKALDRSNFLMKDASNGEGIDRHLLGLRKIAEEEGIADPEIYIDKAWKASGGDGNFTLSTSLVGFFKTIGGLAPMVTDGYGIFYTITDDRLQITVNVFKDSPHTDLEKFTQELPKSLAQISSLLLFNSKL